MAENGGISRVLKLLSLISDHQNLSAKQAATMLGWPVSTTHRLLRRLAESEFSAQTSKGTFTAGMELYRIAGRLSANIPFVPLAEPLLRRLTAKFNETSMLAILERRRWQMYFAALAAPEDPMRYVIDLNSPLPLVWGASGRALLAFMRPDEVEQAITTSSVLSAQGEPLDPDELRADLAEIRRKGFAMSRSHRVRSSIGIAAPFFAGNNEVVGSMAFQIPDFRFTDDALPEIVKALKQAATVISQQIGARPDP